MTDINIKGYRNKN